MPNNFTFPAKNVPALTGTMSKEFMQQLYFSERRWEGISAEVWQVLPPKEPQSTQVNCDTMVLHLQNTVDLQRLVGTYRKRGISYRGGICFEAKGQSNTYFWQGMPVVLLFLFLDPCLVQQIIAEMGRNDPTHVEMVSQFNIHDPLIEQIGFSLVGELESGGVGGRTYAESLARTLVTHLLRLSSTASLMSLPLQRNLTQHQISIVQDAIYDRLDQDISLKDLAASIGMSVSHFCRLFKQSTGFAPHQYVIMCRVERAQSLLHNENLTIAQIASAVGFADQSHLNRHFKDLLGIPPGALRKESKNLQKQRKNIQDHNSH
jgi:AraC family transcriptional regulator